MYIYEHKGVRTAAVFAVLLQAKYDAYAEIEKIPHYPRRKNSLLVAESLLERQMAETRRKWPAMNADEPERSPLQSLQPISVAAG